MSTDSTEKTIVKKLGFFETLKNLLAKEGPGYAVHCFEVSVLMGNLVLSGVALALPSSL